MAFGCSFTLALLVSSTHTNESRYEVFAMPLDMMCNYIVCKILFGVHLIQTFFLVREMNVGWMFYRPSFMTNS